MFIRSQHKMDKAKPGFLNPKLVPIDMVDYHANIRFDAGAAVVQTDGNRFRITGCDTKADNQSCPTELIIGALGS